MSIMNLRAALRVHDEASQAAISAADGLRAAATPDAIRQLIENHDRLGRMLADPAGSSEPVAVPLPWREAEIIQWGRDRNLIGPTGEATRIGQQRKTEEEVQELRDAIEAGDKDAARDAIGDIYVTLVMQAQMWGLSMLECIEAAWHEIKDRKGRMVGGVFVKEGDERLVEQAPPAEPAIDEAALRDALEEPEPAPEYDFAALRARLEEDLVQHDVDMLLPDGDDDRPSVSAQHEARFIRELLAAYDELHRLKGGAPVTLTIDGALADAGILLDDTEGGSHD